MSPRTPENLVRHELIGLDAEVVEAADPGMTGLAGRVVDETRNTLVIGNGEERVVAKDEATFRFALGDARVRVDGTLLEGRPEERILKKFPRKWEYAQADTD